VRASTKHSAHALKHSKVVDGYDAILEVLKGDTVVARLQRGLTYGLEHTAYTLTPNGKTIVSGGSYGDILAYRRTGVVAAAQGKTLKGAALHRLGRAFVGHESTVWAVTPSPDSRYLISGSADQTVRLWNLATRELIVTLFHGRDGEWVMWTPQGYYTGSPGGGALVGWQLNKGPDKAAEYVRGQQLRKKLNRPDIVERAIILASARAALKEAGLENSTVDDILTQTPPVIELKAQEEASGGYARINVKANKNRLPLKSVDVFVGDGEQEAKVTARELPTSGKRSTTKDGGTERSYEIPLHQGPNIIRVVASNEAGESAPQTLTITHNGEGALDMRGTLWLLAVGVDEYPGAKMYQNLSYAGKDAEAFEETIRAKMTASHEHVEATVLVNGGAQGEPTKANIEAALQRIGENAKDQDTVIVFLAGHGENWTGGRYHFLPTDLKRKSRDVIGENVIDWETTIQGAVTRAKGRRIIFVDACQSGAAHNAKLLADAQADRFVAFAATGPNQDALEFETDKWGGGAFTLMLIYGLRGEALDPNQRAVTVYRLGTYVNEKVAEITQGRQTPEYQSGQGNFVLVR
jgi:hypothetical protein